ncbi:MAG: hypothetical protein IT324_30015 [Anaerolineae bacterium]|nr:hypothetical protein [Anaerolineae bacterium]
MDSTDVQHDSPEDFIPLTIDDLRRGLDDATRRKLREALNIRAFASEIARLANKPMQLDDTMSDEVAAR